MHRAWVLVPLPGPGGSRLSHSARSGSPLRSPSRSPTTGSGCCSRRPQSTSPPAVAPRSWWEGVPLRRPFPSSALTWRTVGPCSESSRSCSFASGRRNEWSGQGDIGRPWMARGVGNDPVRPGGSDAVDHRNLLVEGEELQLSVHFGLNPVHVDPDLSPRGGSPACIWGAGPDSIS